MQSSSNEKTKWVVDKINSTASIKLDPMGDTEVITSFWDLVVFHDIDTYFTMIKKSTKLIDKMRDVRIKLYDFKDQCDMVLDNRERQIEELK